MFRNHEAKWWHREGNVIFCDLCPHRCRFVKESVPGLCGLRYRQGESLRTTGWGGASAVHVDPIEKKPLYHFFPGSSTLSLGMSGCNLGCLHCQNWSLSASRGLQEQPIALDAGQIVDMALQNRARSVAFTYNEPLVSAEYWIEVAQECHRHGLDTIAVTNGYASAACAREFFSHMDAANVDLKAFSEAFYRNTCKGHLQPVLDTLQNIRALAVCHLEITTLLIPGKNDSPSEIHALARWILENLGADVPLHFSAFHPDYKAQHWLPTSTQEVLRARRMAQQEGLAFVYGGNISDEASATTFCSKCGAVLLLRNGFTLLHNHLSPEGRCPTCDAGVPGKMS